MPARNKFPELLDNMNQYMGKRYGISEFRKKRTIWILKRFFYYAIRAAIHGYRIPIYHKGWFELMYMYWHAVPWSMRKRNMFSSKAWGYQFTLKYRGYPLDGTGFIFKPAMKWVEEIEELIETDAVYDLIPNQ